MTLHKRKCSLRNSAAVCVLCVNGAFQRRGGEPQRARREDAANLRIGMAADLNNEKLIARYLLDDLPEEQQVEIEDRAFADKDYLALVTAVENDLIDEYVQNDLSPTERRQFETRFLASAERRKRLEFAKALARVPVPAAERTVVSEPAQWFWRDSLYAFISGLNPAAKFAVVAVMLLLIAGGAWLLTETLRLRSQLTQLQAQNQW